MDIVVKGRNVEVPEHYRVHVEEKLARLERYDRKVIRFDVELFHEPNRRQAKNCQRVEITGKGRGPAVRVRGVCGRLLRRAGRRGDQAREPTSQTARPQACALRAPQPVLRRGGHRWHAARCRDARRPTAARGTAVLPARTEELRGRGPVVPAQRWDGAEDDNLPGRVVREKEHPADPMTVDQALYQMELVGHDFYLFNDSDCGQPSVVYRRRGFDYGVIRLV